MTGADRGPVGVRLLLGSGRFRGPFLGNLVAAVGERLHHLAAAIVIYELRGTALSVGVLTALQFGAPLLITPIAGSLIDRTDRRRLLRASQLCKVVGGLISAASVTLGAGGAIGLFVGTGLIGIGQGVAVPTWQSYLPSLVPRSALPDAVALNSVAFNLSRAVGPLLGAAIVVVSPTPVAFLVATGAALGFWVVLGGSATDRPLGEPATAAFSTVLRSLRHRPEVVRPLVGMVALAVAADPPLTLAPAIAAALGGATVSVGAIAASFGMGAVASAPLASAWRRTAGIDAAGRRGLGLAFVGTIGLMAAPSVASALVAVAIAGAGYLVGAASLTTVLHLGAPDAERGRVMVLWSLAFMGSRPIAALAHGWAADQFGVRWAPGVAVVALLVAMVTLRRRHD